MTTPTPETIISDLCSKDDMHGWCTNRNFKETHCQCACHKKTPETPEQAAIKHNEKLKSILYELEKILLPYYLRGTETESYTVSSHTFKNAYELVMEGMKEENERKDNH
jgi:hypothetical protein